jgi:hypothetical protein
VKPIPHTWEVLISEFVYIKVLHVSYVEEEETIETIEFDP